MAENKKSFVLYSDLIHSIETLTDSEAGTLFKHILRYVNDKNPDCPDRITQIAFEPIKQQLKRDLAKYETTKITKSDSGILGNLKRWYIDLYNDVVSEKITLEKGVEIAKHRKASQSIANIAVNVNDNVSVSDTVNVNVTETVKEKKNTPIGFNFKKALIDLGVSEPVATDWMSVRAKKRASNTVTAFNVIAKEIAKTGLSAEHCITEAVARSWSGFNHTWLNNSISNGNKQFATNAEKSAGLDRMVEQSKEHLQQLANKYGK